ncbi:MAG: hypothetical protein MZV64_18170 [Ignavibacteriales bacterium]|nr:hypothetical protein [Ignavibacteriales bacterium]
MAETPRTETSMWPSSAADRPGWPPPWARSGPGPGGPPPRAGPDRSAASSTNASTTASGCSCTRRPSAGPEYAERLAEDVAREGDQGRDRGHGPRPSGRTGVLRVNAREGYRLVRAGAVVLAMGCRERTAGHDRASPATRPAGICTAGSAQNLVNLRNLRVGNEAVILGSGDIGLIMARRLTFEGDRRSRASSRSCPGPAASSGTSASASMDFGIPLELAVHRRRRPRPGPRRERRRRRGRRAAWRPSPGPRRVVACDTLLAVGRAHPRERALEAGRGRALAANRRGRRRRDDS